MEGLSVDYGKVYTTIIMGIIHMYCAYIHCSHCIRESVLLNQCLMEIYGCTIHKIDGNKKSP